MHVSIIMPAHNAAATMERSIQSALAQTHPDWELLIIDNGSTDETAQIAARWAAQDVRIRALSEPTLGVSLARNRGLAEAWFDWIMFLDADDTLTPNALQLLTEALRRDPKLSVVHGAWDRMHPSGDAVPNTRWPVAGDLFPIFAHTCAYAIHACVANRKQLLDVGGFAGTLKTCEDWDLWQRLARSGAKFGYVEQLIAYYHMRAGSASGSGWQLARDGVIVVRRGHAPDPRVKKPARKWRHGQDPSKLPSALLYMLSWSAGLLIGSGEDADALLALLEGIRCPEIEAQWLSSSMVPAILLPGCKRPADWPELWPEVEPRVERFFRALEQHNQTPGFCARALTAARRVVARELPAGDDPIVLGDDAFVQREVTQPFGDLILPASVKRIECRVRCEGEEIGSVELPVFDGRVLGIVLADAIAGRFYWALLERFMRRHCYPRLRITRHADGYSVWHGDTCLEPNFQPHPDWFWLYLHNQLGWVCIVQDLWNAPGAAGNALLSGTLPSDAAAPERAVSEYCVTLEITDDPVTLVSELAELLVLATAGGAPLCHFTLPVVQKRVPWSTLRREIMRRCGKGLYLVAAREAILGQPLAAGPASLRERLLARARSPSDEADRRLRAFAGAWFRGADAADAAAPELPFIPCREGEQNPRRACLPRGARGALDALAELTGEPVVDAPDAQGPIAYLPDVRPAVRDQDAQSRRQAYERMFRATPDPWHYASAYERKKYEQTLELLPAGRIPRALELACAEGWFTHRLAKRVDSLLATDFSGTALEHARRRCAGFSNVSFRELDFAEDTLDAGWDLIVCSEALYDAGNLENLRAIVAKIAAALAPGGMLLTTHAELADDSDTGVGFAWALRFGARTLSRILRESTDLTLESELCVPLYRVQLWRRRSPGASREIAPVSRVLTRQPAPLEEQVAAHARLPDAALAPAPGRNGQHAPTLPILMYHRVAPAGADATRRWRLSPREFEQQLASLQRLGFHSVTFGDWARAVAGQKPLPGRPVMLTFDDGYLDFYEHAWPLLRRYGFGATMFLVADRIGGSNSWDAGYGEQLPLMNWRQIHELQVDGIEFGSHTVSHPFLTTLTPEQQAEELIRSRTQLVRELGRCDTLAYPYGDCDEITRHIAGACGYNFAVTCEHGEAGLDAGALALPRIEVRGDQTFEQFQRHLVAPLHLRGIRRAQRSRAYQWARRRVSDAAFEAGKRWYLARFG